jgi:hypothetical protein
MNPAFCNTNCSWDNLKRPKNIEKIVSDKIYSKEQKMANLALE